MSNFLVSQMVGLLVTSIYFYDLLIEFQSGWDCSIRSPLTNINLILHYCLIRYNYPEDASTWNDASQFMWGKGLLISPVLDQGKVFVNAYFPGDQPWFVYYK